jgi:hypothetical protein
MKNATECKLNLQIKLQRSISAAEKIKLNVQKSNDILRDLSNAPTHEAKQIFTVMCRNVIHGAQDSLDSYQQPELQLLDPSEQVKP